MRAVVCLLLFAAVASAADVPADPKYAAAVAEFERFIRQELEQKKLSALSIALVDDQRVVWSAGFGFIDESKSATATADTVFRVGAYSELLTTFCVMQLVEQGKLNLHVPIGQYLDAFRPANPFADSPVTLSHLLTHRSGLVRQPPKGNYFDPEDSSTAKMIVSLTDTQLAFRPGERHKYSAADTTVVRGILEAKQKQLLDAFMLERVLIAMDIHHPELYRSSWTPSQLGRGVLQTAYDRNVQAPRLERANDSRVAAYFSTIEYAQMLKALFGNSILKQKSLDNMMTPPEGDTEGYGLGLALSHLGNRRLFEHTEGTYGTIAYVAGLPDEKLGVVVMTTRENAGALTSRIGTEALTLMAAAKDGSPLTKIAASTAINWQATALQPGYYAVDDSKSPALRIEQHHDRAFLWPLTGGSPAELRQVGDSLQTDDIHQRGTRLDDVKHNEFRIDEWVYRRLLNAKPQAAKTDLIAEYGYDEHLVYVLEELGRLYVLIDWHFLDPLRPVKDDEYVFFGNSRYAGESVVFHRDASGRSTSVIIGGVTLPRRKIDGDGGTFRIQPVRPVDVLMKEALASTPPPPKGELATPDLVDLARLDATLKFDVRYATANNFLGTPVYPIALALLQRPAANALAKAHRELGKDGYGLLIHDAYRPWHVTKVFWDATPKAQHTFVADPAIGSRHNRGCAVDLTLYELKTGQSVMMPGGYDEFSDRSYPRYPGGTALQRWHREMLRAAMESNGFTVYEAEWWHFDYRDWKKYPILNVALSEFQR